MAASDKAHELAPNDALHAFDQTRIHLRRGELDEAQRALQTYFDAKETKWGTRPYELLSEILEREGLSRFPLPAGEIGILDRLALGGDRLLRQR